MRHLVVNARGEALEHVATILTLNAFVRHGVPGWFAGRRACEWRRKAISRSSKPALESSRELRRCLSTNCQKSTATAKETSPNLTRRNFLLHVQIIAGFRAQKLLGDAALGALRLSRLLPRVAG